MERRNKVIFELVFIILVIFLNIFNINYIFTSQKKTVYIKTVKYSTKDTTELKEQIEFYNNIDNKIIELKDEYFSNIRLLEEKIQNGTSDKKIAYLTFDDGPYKLTYTVLDILKNNDVRATFFVRGIPSASDRYVLMAQAGHTIGNHTYSHNIFNGLYSSSTEFIRQVDKLDNLIYETTGLNTRLLRFPGGSPSAGKLKNDIVNKLHDKGYRYVDWTCHTGDGSSSLLKQKKEWNWYKDTCSGQKIFVILMHDYNYGTVEILDDMIKDLKNQGYLILPLSNKSLMTN